MIAILAACDNYTIPTPPCEDGATGVSYSGDIQSIFNSNCVSCHSGAQSPDLREGWSYDELISGSYVAEPEFACESKLYQIFSDLTMEELPMKKFCKSWDGSRKVPRITNNKI